MSRKLAVKHQDTFAYHIYLEQSFDMLHAALKELDTEGRKALLITDEHVAPLYLQEVLSQIESAFTGVSVLIMEPGEQNKNLEGIERIYEAMIDAGLSRKDLLIALGGGVVGDMTGYAAASYMRGIRFIQIPTTLLAQVDSSIGGKTGVDFRSYKNMVGAFHMPSLVYSNISALKTLDAEQYASGMGEVIKHALIKDAEYLTFLKGNQQKLHQRDTDVLEETVFRSNLIKREVVEKDPTEQGERACLNFGHTLGHAIEKCSDFQYSHGQCVAFGSLCAMEISGISEEERMEIAQLMQASGLETVLKEMSVDDVIAASKKDKKMDKGQVRFICLKKIGEAWIDPAVPDDMLKVSLQHLMNQ